MALFDLNDDEKDRAASGLTIELNDVDDVRAASLDQDEDGTHVEVVLDAEFDRVPASVVWPVYNAEFGITDVLLPRGDDDQRSIIVEVRP